MTDGGKEYRRIQLALDKANRAKESGVGTGIRRNSFLGVKEGSAVSLADIAIDFQEHTRRSVTVNVDVRVLSFYK